MNAHSEKPSLKTTFELNDMYHYDFYNGTSTTPKPRGYLASALNYLGLVQWIDTHNENASRQDIDPSVELQVMFDEAKGFVEQLMGST